jgi:hypothetical protein
MGGIVVHLDAEFTFGVGDGAVSGVLNRDAYLIEGGVRGRVQNGSSDRPGLSKTGLGQEAGKKEKNDLS